MTWFDIWYNDNNSQMPWLDRVINRATFFDLWPPQ